MLTRTPGRLGLGTAIAILAVVAAPAAGQCPPAAPPASHRPGAAPAIDQQHRDEVPPSDPAREEAARQQQARALQSYREGNLSAAEAACRAILPRPVATGHPAAAPTRDEMIVKLLGDILLDEGRNQEAVACYEEAYPTVRGNTIDVQRVIAWCRAGNAAGAWMAYRDWAERSGDRATAANLTGPGWPGVGTPDNLQAGALLVRSLGRQRGTAAALADRFAAEWLAPRNPVVAYHLGSLLQETRRLPEALVRFRRAARYGQGDLAAKARAAVVAVGAALREAGSEAAAKRR